MEVKKGKKKKQSVKRAMKNTLGEQLGSDVAGEKREVIKCCVTFHKEVRKVEVKNLSLTNSPFSHTLTHSQAGHLFRSFIFVEKLNCLHLQESVSL